MNETRPMMALGKHWIVECYECDRELLNNPRALEALLRRVAEDSGCTIVDSHFHAYQPQGVSGAVFILESHFTIHTWPEYRYAAVDGFGCGDSIDIDTAMRVLRKGLRTEEVVLAGDLNRGIVSEKGLTRVSSVSIRRIEGVLSWKEHFERREARAIQVSIDLHDCDLGLIGAVERLKTFTQSLIDRFELGDSRKSWSMSGNESSTDAMIALWGPTRFCLVSTPSQRDSRRCFVDVLNCDFVDPYSLGLYCKDTLRAESFDLNVNLRA
jgi:S-adenosylmethionine decarboxylase